MAVRTIRRNSLKSRNKYGWILVCAVLMVLTGCQSKSQEDKEAVKDNISVTSDKKMKNLNQTESWLKPMFENQAFEEAWQDYKKILDTLDLSNPIEPQNGSNAEEFDNKVQLSQDFEKIDISNDSYLKVYKYETDEPFNRDIDDQPGRANLYILFKNDVLSFVGVGNSSFLFQDKNLLSQDRVANLTKQPFSFESLKIAKPVVLNYGKIVVNNNSYEVTTMLSGKAENVQAEMFAVVDGQLDYITTKSLEDVDTKEYHLMVTELSDYVMEYSGEFYQLHRPQK